jgi:hypothetical protein
VTEYVPAAFTPAFVIVGFCAEELNPFGPFQLYEEAPEGDAESVRDCPAQIIDDPEAAGAAGMELTATLSVAAGLVQPFCVVVAEYVPVAVVDAADITGFCVEEEKPGPDQVKMVPVPFAVRLRFDPAQSGPLEEIDGAAGAVFTVTATTVFAPPHPATLMLTL